MSWSWISFIVTIKKHFTLIFLTWTFLNSLLKDTFVCFKRKKPWKHFIRAAVYDCIYPNKPLLRGSCDVLWYFYYSDENYTVTVSCQKLTHSSDSNVRATIWTNSLLSSLRYHSSTEVSRCSNHKHPPLDDHTSTTWDALVHVNCANAEATEQVLNMQCWKHLLMSPRHIQDQSDILDTPTPWRIFFSRTLNISSSSVAKTIKLY